MCGICGFAGQGGDADLAAMNASLARRGPDGQGVFSHPARRLYLGHRRLAIIDLEGGAQPMSTADGELVVVFNGEIYNHLELRRELEDLGHVFATDHSDTEVLLHGYRQWGRDLSARLNGMWAFALFDRGAGQLLLSRDRFGKKPLFYLARPDLFAFGSELTALSAHSAARLTVSTASLRKYFAYGFIPAPRTLYAEARKLPGGHDLTLDLSDLSARVRRYWSYCIEPEPAPGRDPEGHYAARLRETLQAATARRLMSDVPLGVFLSGGVDSTSVAWFASRLAPDTRTFSIGFDAPAFDESAMARAAAAWCGARHHETVLTLSEALAILPEMAARLDEPMGDSSLAPTYLLCRETRKFVTVALGGDGADELFAGYDPFRAIRAAFWYDRVCPKPVHRAARLLAARLPASHGYMAATFKVNRFLRGLSRERRLWNPVWLGPLCPDELAALFGSPADLDEVYEEAIECFEGCPSKDMVDKTLEFYTRLYLQDGILVKTDRAGMMHSLEVRAPYLDVEMADLARRIPHQWKFRRGVTKYVLKKALEPLLPRSIVHRQKKGFAMPVGRWLAEGALVPPRPLPGEPFDQGFIDRLTVEHRTGRADHRLFLWNLWLLRRMAPSFS